MSGLNADGLRPKPFLTAPATAVFFDRSPHASLLLDANWTVLQANAAAEWLAVDGQFPDFVQISGLPRPAVASDRAAGLTLGWSRRMRVTGADGRSRQVDVSLVVANPDDAAEVALQYFAVLCDVSAAVQTARVGQEQESRSKQSVDATPVLIRMSGTDMRCEWFNKPWLKFRGRTLGDEIGEGWLQGVHPEDLERCLGVHENGFEAREPFSMDYRLLRHDGVYRWVLDTGLPRFDDDGRFLGYIGTCIDITERRDLEDRLAEHARGMRLADRRREDFLANLSYRLREPLAPIANAGAILRSLAAGDTRLVKACDILERQTTRLRDLVTELVDVTRLMKGKVVLQRETVRVEDLLAAAVAMAREQLDARRQALATAPFDHGLECHADLHRLTLAVAALLDNASKYSPEGATIRLDVQTFDEQIEIRVIDEGAGIAPDFLPHVFELFAQDATGHDGGRGSGVGLTVARRVAHLHGGELQVLSAGEGCGTEARLRLPRLSRTDAADSELDVSAIRGQRVLIVEENADARESLRMLMEMRGNDVMTAADADEAMHIAESFPPELVVCEIGLSGAGGLDVVQRFRSKPAFAHTRFVALTGHGRTEDRDRALASGFDAFQVKPLASPPSPIPKR